MTTRYLALGALVLLVGCADRSSGRPHQAPEAGASSAAARSALRETVSAGSAPNAAALAPDSGSGQWSIPAKNYASTRYSDLGEITSSNVARLQLAWTFSTGVMRGHEAAPLVVGGTMYVADAVSQHSVCARPDPARRADQVEIRAPPRPGVAGCGVLRRGEPRRHLRGGQDLLQHAGCAHGGRGRCHGQRGLEHPGRRHQQWARA